VSLLKSTDTMSSRAHVPSAHVGLEAYIGVSVSGHGAEAQVELLRSQVSLLEKSITQLETSNLLMMKENPEDQDFIEAVDENLIVIDKYRSSIADLQREIGRLEPAVTSVSVPPYEDSQGPPGLFL